MKTRFYFHTIRDATVQFMDTFDDIIISRYNSAGSAVGNVPVRVKFAPKEKIWYYLRKEENEKQSLTLPIISVFIIGMNYVPTREKDHKYDTIFNPTISGAEEALNILKNPVPYNIDYTVSIWTRYQEDANQILERILTWSSPMMEITLKEPITEAKLNCSVYHTGVTPTIEMEYSDNDGPIIRWELSYTLQTWLYKPLPASAVSKLIKYIKINNRIMESRETSATNKIYSTLSLSGISATSASSGASIMFNYEKIDTME